MAAGDTSLLSNVLDQITMLPPEAQLPVSKHLVMLAGMAAPDMDVWAATVKKQLTDVKQAIWLRALYDGVDKAD